MLEDRKLPNVREFIIGKVRKWHDVGFLASQPHKTAVVYFVLKFQYSWGASFIAGWVVCGTCS